MHTIAMIANLLATAVFVWLTYKAVCTSLATPGRCRLLRGLRSEFQEQTGRLAAELDRVAEQVRKNRVTPAAAKVRKLPDWQGAAAAAGMPADYRPAGLLHRVAMARLAGDAELAWDEYRHWLQRISFGWSAQLSHGKQAKEFGLLFTVVGALLAFANLSQVSKPFEVFGALSLAMLTTIVGLLLSLLVSHCLVQRFYFQYRQLQIDSEAAVLTILRHAGRWPPTVRPARRRVSKRTAASGGNGQTPLPAVAASASPLVLYANACHDANGGVRCAEQ